MPNNENKKPDRTYQEKKPYRNDNRAQKDRAPQGKPDSKQKRYTGDDRFAGTAQKRTQGGDAHISRAPAHRAAEYKQPPLSQEEVPAVVPHPAETEDLVQETGIHGELENGNVIGRSAVRELLRSGRSVDKILVQPGDRKGSIVSLVAQALKRRIPVIETEKAKMDELAGFAPHQGIIAMAAEKDYCELDDIFKVAEERGEAPVIVLCDEITDPYNLGAIIRCAECCGAHGVVIPKRRAAGLTPLVTKASAGALEYMAIAKVSSILGTIEELKTKNVWVYAAEAGGQAHYDVNFSGGCAIVLGSEGDGVSQVVKKACDGIVSIPMYGKVNSFNVSTAAAVILAEIARQHHKN